MSWSPWHEWRVRGAALFAVAAAMLLLASAVMALRDHAESAAPPLAATAIDPMPVPTVASSLDRDAAARLFTPAQSSASAPAATADAAAPAVTLIGTIAGGDQPSAVCRLGAAGARLLHVGDTIGGWRLQRITPGRAVFIDGTARPHELRFTSPGN